MTCFSTGPIWKSLFFSELLKSQWSSWPCFNSCFPQQKARSASDQCYRRTLSSWVLRGFYTDLEIVLAMIPLLQHCCGNKWNLIILEEDMKSGRGTWTRLQRHSAGPTGQSCNFLQEAQIMAISKTHFPLQNHFPRQRLTSHKIFFRTFLPKCPSLG